MPSLMFFLFASWRGLNTPIEQRNEPVNLAQALPKSFPFIIFVPIIWVITSLSPGYISCLFVIGLGITLYFISHTNKKKTRRGRPLYLPSLLLISTYRKDHQHPHTYGQLAGGNPIPTTFASTTINRAVAPGIFRYS